MVITLSELRLHLDARENLVTTLNQRLKEVSKNIYKKQKDSEKELLHEAHAYDFNQLMVEMENTKKEIRQLRLVSTKANCETMIDFTIDGEKISLQEGIYLIKQLRIDLSIYQSYSNIKTSSRYVDPLGGSYSYGSKREGAAEFVYEEITQPTYSTAEMRAKVEKTEKLILKLETAINKANLITEVDIPFIEE